MSVDVHDILVIELEPGHGIAGFQMLRLFAGVQFIPSGFGSAQKRAGSEDIGTQKASESRMEWSIWLSAAKLTSVVPIGIEGMLHNLCIADVAITKICRGLPDSEATFSD